MGITKYLDWQKQGNRSIDLTAEPNSPVKIWCYDYDLSVGAYVTHPAPPPTTEELKDKMAARLRAELATLEATR